MVFQGLQKGRRSSEPSEPLNFRLLVLFRAPVPPVPAAFATISGSDTSYHKQTVVHRYGLNHAISSGRGTGIFLPARRTLRLASYVRAFRWVTLLRWSCYGGVTVLDKQKTSRALLEQIRSYRSAAEGQTPDSESEEKSERALVYSNLTTIFLTYTRHGGPRVVPWSSFEWRSKSSAPGKPESSVERRKGKGESKEMATWTVEEEAT